MHNVGSRMHSREHGSGETSEWIERCTGREGRWMGGRGQRMGEGRGERERGQKGERGKREGLGISSKRISESSKSQE